MENEHLPVSATKIYKVLIPDLFVWGVPEDGTVGLGEYFNI